MHIARLLLVSVGLLVACSTPPPPCTTCGDVCVDVQNDSANCGTCGTACASGTRCAAGVCALTCAASQSACGGLCVDLKADEANCGACGQACGAGQRCTAGACASSCAAGATACGGACFDLASNPAHCGTCDTTCAAGEYCAVGACTSTCPTPLTVCGGSACVDTQTNPANCGHCGTPCAAGLRCVAGQCAATCGGGTTACGDACLDLKSDPAHCGGCGTACAAGEYCASGLCTSTCPGPLSTCTAACVDEQSDSKNCGACNHACAPGTRCTAGACVDTCPGTQVVCAAACVDKATDPANCGACGTVCGAGTHCVAGACAASCGGATSACGLACFDLQSDPTHCGGCGTACAAGAFCAAGHCTNTCPLAVCGTACVDPQSNANHCGACDQACPGGSRCQAGACVATCAPGFLDCNASPLDGCETVGPTCFTLVSVGIDGTPANAASWGARVDNSGRYVLFTSIATNLVPGDTNLTQDAFLRDTVLGTTTRVSTMPDGGQLTQDIVGAALSGDGRTVVFGTSEAVLPGDTNSGYDVVVVPLDGGAWSYGLLGMDGGQPRNNTYAFAGPQVSADGRVVMSSGRMSGLVPGDTIQSESDIFVYDRLTPSIKVASLTPAGGWVTSGAVGYNAAASLMSGNGRYVAYGTFGYVVDFSGTGCWNSHVTDLSTTPPKVVRLQADDGTLFTCGTDRIAAQGGLVNDTGTAMYFGTRTRVPGATLAATTDLYRRAAVTSSGPSTRLTRAPDGGYPNGTSSPASLSDDGALLGFVSTATDLLAGDVNGQGQDCFVWHGDAGVARVNAPLAQQLIVDGGTSCVTMSLSHDGTWTAMEMNDALVPADTNGVADIYLRRTP